MEIGTRVRNVYTGKTGVITDVIDSEVAPIWEVTTDDGDCSTGIPSAFEEIPEIRSVMDSYRQDAEVIYPIPAMGGNEAINNGPMTLSVAKLGGGTLGRKYTGRWIIEIHHNGRLIQSTSLLDTKQPASHLRAACIYAEFMGHAPMGERLALWVDGSTAP